MKSNRTWIVYKTESMSAEGWEARKLLPAGGLTNILWETWDYSGRMPQPGERIREYANLADPGNGVTHGKEGDWIVSRVHQFSSPDTQEKIIVCYCQFSPIDAGWEELKRGTPIDELLAVSLTKG